MHILDTFHLLGIIFVLKLGQIGWVDMTLYAKFYQFIIGVNEVNILMESHAIYVDWEWINWISMELQKMRKLSDRIRDRGLEIS